MISLFRLPYHPRTAERPYLGRVQAQSDDRAEISVAVLTPSECRVVFGVPLANRGIQASGSGWPIARRRPTRVLFTRVARDYYTAREAAGVCHFSISKRLLTFDS